MDAETSPETKALGQTSPLTDAEARLVIWGVLVPVFMGSLDQTILAGALPTIGRDFGDIHNLPWLITAYLIAATAATPLYGKISDIRGRRVTINAGIVLYMAGSLVCALAPNMPVLILGRVLHGIGGGGISSVGMVVLGDVAAPKDRGKYYFYFSATYTTAGACGPALGGFFAEYLHWSVIFWMNLVLGIVALVLTNTLMRRLPRRERPHRLDFLGAFLIVAASVPLMLALNMGGVRYPWTSLPILALGAVSLGLAALFVLRLITAREPLIPIAVLTEPVAAWAMTANAFGWGTIMGLNIFLPMFLQSVAGLSATAAGLSLMTLMVAVNTSAGVTGRRLGRVKHYKTVPILGLGLAAVSATALGIMADRIDIWTFQLLLALIGIGFGPTPPLVSVALQNVVAPHQFGTAIGTMNFTRTLFGTFLIAVFGAIVLAGTSPGEGASLAQHSLAAGFSRVFYAGAASFAVAFVALLLMEEKPLKTGQP
jgi:MFS family permease